MFPLVIQFTLTFLPFVDWRGKRKKREKKKGGRTVIGFKGREESNITSFCLTTL